MKRINWELMRPQDIEVRPAMTKDGKATLLLYQNSRTAMDALDRNFGEFGWQIEYKAVGEQIYGCLSIKDPETGEWISKMDTGEESNISASKGQSSDILKRCAVRFGYARELYTAPRIVVEDDKYGNTGNKVSKIEYNENREIVALVIVNRFGKTVFEWMSDTQKTNDKQDIRVQARSEDTPEQRRLAQLQCWFVEKKKDPNVNKTELVKFKDHYKAQAATFKYPNFDCDRLWSIWINRVA